MRVRFPLPAPTCLRLAAQDSRLSSGTTRVQIPQAGPNPPSLKLRRANRQPVEARSAKIGFVPLRLTAGCRTLNAAIVVRIHEGEPTRNAGVAQRQSGALIRRRSVVQINPPAPAFPAARLRLASHLRGEGCPPKPWRRRAMPTRPSLAHQQSARPISERRQGQHLEEGPDRSITM